MITPRAPMLWALVLAALPCCAAAQSAHPVELSAGYQYMRDSTADLNLAAGWTVGGGYRVCTWLSVAGAYDDSRTAIGTPIGDLHFGLRSLMGGFRTSARVWRATPFVQILGGAVRGSGSAFGSAEAATHFGAQGGIGADYSITSRFAIRAEFDYQRVINKGGDDARQVRGVTAIVFKVFE